MIDFIIKIPFKIFGFTFGVRRYRRSLPGAWSVIHDTERRLFYFRTLQLDPTPAAFIPILRDMLKLKDFYFYRIEPNDITVFTEILAWMREPLPIRALIPNFTHEGVTYHFFKPDFDNGTAFDFAIADDYYTEYVDNQDNTDALLLLASALVYTDSEPRNTKEIIEKRLNTFKNLSFDYILVALRYFEALKKEIHEVGENVGLFDTPTTEGDAENTEMPIHFGWWTSYRFIAKSQVFGDYEKVLKTQFWDILKNLIEEKQREETLRKRYAALNAKTQP